MMSHLPEIHDALNDPYFREIDKRLTRVGLIIGIAIASAVALGGRWNFLVSFLAGASVSFVNFFWLKQAIDRLLLLFQGGSVSLVQQKRGERRLILKYLLRYSLIGCVLYAIVRLRFFDATGAILGLLLCVMAVLYECVHQVVATLLEDRRNGRA
ncbi:MAG: ATP synthase subunit I [Acidobacteriota bacterium]